jgi:membrane protease YdiL (CAAX protease family)
MNTAITLPTVVGLVVALGGVALLASPAARWLGDPGALRTRVLEQLALWLLFGAVLGIVLFWENHPLSSIGVRSGWVRSVAMAGVLTPIVVLVVSPAAIRLVAAGGFSSVESGVVQFSLLPIWLKLFAVLTAGVVEETLFRGYALERLAGLLGSVWVAAVITLVVFAVVHWPLWGTGGVLVILCTGAVFTVFFVWQRDLVANVVAHVAVDAVGLVVVMLLKA